MAGQETFQITGELAELPKIGYEIYDVLVELLIEQTFLLRDKDVYLTNILHQKEEKLKELETKFKIYRESLQKKLNYSDETMKTIYDSMFGKLIANVESLRQPFATRII